jgi:hypothetical protein
MQQRVHDANRRMLQLASGLVSTGQNMWSAFFVSREMAAVTLVVLLMALCVLLYAASHLLQIVNKVHMRVLVAAAVLMLVTWTVTWRLVG